MVRRICREARVLVINPNSNVAMTQSMQPVLTAMKSSTMTLEYWTCPTGPSIIKSQADMYESALHCLPLLLAMEKDYDGFLGACYADHPLVRLLQSYVGSKPVVGIFDASIVAAMQLVSDGSKFGIITTGPAYETMLRQGVKALIGSKDDYCSLFGGVAASGIGLEDLEIEARRTAREKIFSATRRLVQMNCGKLDVVVMGGVILSGMETWVHEALVLDLGVEKAGKVKVIDQLVAGALTLAALLKCEGLHTVDYGLALK